MDILILGGGVVGVTSAWYLAQAGHKVRVIDRQESVALETSYANAGQISPGYAAPWAAPGIPLKAMKWLMQDLAPFSINRKELDKETLIWMTQMLRNCTEGAYHANKARMMRLAEYSRDCLKALRNTLDLQYEGRTKGTLQVFRTNKQVAASQKDISVLEECGVPYQALDRDGCIAYEPALAYVKEKFVGGLHLPGDETGDCFKFTTQLAEECRKIGVEFILDTEIMALKKAQGQLERVVTNKGNFTADAYVMALGSFSKHMLDVVGVRIPVYPIKGYSLTLPIIDADKAPTSTVMDETYKVAITRFDDRIRVGGTAEIASYNTDLLDKRRANIAFVVQDLFPGGGDIAKADFWTGLRPMTPDGTPILGKTPIDNLFLNTGHGTLGWTMSVGSGKYIADIISDKEPDIHPEGLSIARYTASDARKA
jgi:D-amino-acid dehydrogenase